MLLGDILEIIKMFKLKRMIIIYNCSISNAVGNRNIVASIINILRQSMFSSIRWNFKFLITHLTDILLFNWNLGKWLGK